MTGSAENTRTLHPKMARKLEPGETIIRSGTGRGLNLTVLEMAAFGVWALLFGGGAISALQQSPGSPPVTMGIAIVFVLVVPLVLFCMAVQSHGTRWALTDRRLMFLRGPGPDWPLNHVWSLSGEKIIRHTRIRELTVMGGKDRGRITLRGLTWSSEPVVTLMDVERPLELAALIKSTLRLDLPIQDYTREAPSPA